MMHIVQAPAVRAAPPKHDQPVRDCIVGRAVPVTRHGRVASGSL